MDDYFDKLEDQYAKFAINSFFKQLTYMAEAAAKLKATLYTNTPDSPNGRATGFDPVQD